jgi:lipopolysaccharide export system permease protein
MIPVIIAASLLGVGLIWFNNDVLPEANHAASNLRGDIQRMRPTFQIRSGVFVDYIPGYIILADEVDHERSTLKGVVIYDQKDQRHSRTITADSGTIEFSAVGEYITFNLMSGQIHEQDLTQEGEYRVSEFENQTFVVQDLGTRLEETDREYRGDREMSAGHLALKTNAWRKEIDNYRKMIVDDTDSSLNLILSAPGEAVGFGTEDSLSVRRQMVGKAYKEHNSVTRLLRTRKGQIHSNTKLVSKYSVEIHKKYALPAACLAFILIGAPLGVMGRKAGMAISVGMSIGLFTVYWAFLIGGEQLADRLIIAPWLAMWAANFVLVAIGLALLYRVKNERPFVEMIQDLLRRS